MNSRAKIGTLAKTDPALLVPYGGEQRAIGELQALGVTLTPEDYRAIRQSLGGGKKGRARARELVPLECPRCESRLTHYERNGREPYFAATSDSSSHGPHCDMPESDAAPAVPALAAVPELAAVSDLAAVPELIDIDTASLLASPTREVAAAIATAVAVANAEVTVDEVTVLSDDDLELAAESSRAEPPRAATPPVSPPLRADEQLSPPPVRVEARPRAREQSSDAPTHYIIAGEPEPSAGAQRLARLGLGRTTSSASSAPAEPSGKQLAHARELLIQGLNRALPAHSTVRYLGQDYVVVAAADLHEHKDGDRVAVYGRLIEAEWSAAAGRLTLKATPRSVQVWATSAAPRQLLQVDTTLRSPGQEPRASSAPLLAPVLSKPAPFLAFGTLRRLGPTCGIPVIRGDSLVLLQPLSALSREPSAEQTAAGDGLTLLPSMGEHDEPRDSEPDVPRDSEPSVPRDSELYELDGSQLADLRSRAEEPGALAAPPTSFADARPDGLELLPASLDRATTGLPAPNATHPPARGALSTLRSFASSLRRSKPRGGPA